MHVSTCSAIQPRRSFARPFRTAIASKWAQEEGSGDRAPHSRVARGLNGVAPDPPSAAAGALEASVAVALSARRPPASTRSFAPCGLLHLAPPARQMHQSEGSR
eukprot:15345350-Alexandrium_andersonii.AAC.1